MFYKMAEHWQSIVGNDTSAIYATNIAQHWASLRYTSREREREREIAFIKIVFCSYYFEPKFGKKYVDQKCYVPR